MQLTLSTVTAILAAAGSALAASTPPNTFNLQVRSTGSDVHLSRVSATKGSFFGKLPKQGATCKVQKGSTTPNDATFYIREGQLFLYSTDKPTQQAFVDRSGMGQGKLGYINAGGALPSRWEVKGWTIDANGNLKFNGAGLIACPKSIDNAWSIWVNAGNPNPGFNQNCRPMSAYVLEQRKPVSCRYTTQ